ncbi:hypothetical protein [Herbaspirillum aquaticum]|uniref:hypothetical protein n=1 Tax=Herbaspirillum aquaticum TaxID=568783 RepID=UPI0024DE4F23|nr:hypothetical protein [Herbaspirillum aquaticum]
MTLTASAVAEIAPHGHREDRQHGAACRSADKADTTTKRIPPEHPPSEWSKTERPNTMHPDIVREETCAIRQDAFCKVHRKFVTVETVLQRCISQ